MNTLLYLSYGQGPHELEVIFSSLSARRAAKSKDVFRMVVYTDNPDAFTNQSVDVHFVAPEQWNLWAGPKQFNHRRKILALQDALAAASAPVVLLDGDTWLKGSVQQLFDRVGPGRSVMHIREGKVDKVNTPVYRQMKATLERAVIADVQGRQIQIPPHAVMWNAGVIGLHPVDAPLLDEVLDLTDQLCKISDSHVLEQFAFSYVLGMRTELREAADLVFHYWPPYLHKPFRAKLPQLMKSVEHLPLAQRIENLYSHRPRPGLVRRSKVIAKRMLQQFGLIRGQCRSNEW